MSDAAVKMIVDFLGNWIFLILVAWCVSSFLSALGRSGDK